MRFGDQLKIQVSMSRDLREVEIAEQNRACQNQGVMIVDAVSADRGRVFSLEWRTLMPELEPVMTALQTCGRQVRESFDDLEVHPFFACDSAPSGSSACTEQAKKHLRHVQQPTDEVVKWYKQNEKMRTERWPRGRPSCTSQSGTHTAHHHKQSAVGGAGGGANASVWLGDFFPCATGQDRYVVYLRSNTSMAAAVVPLEVMVPPGLRTISRAELKEQVEAGKVWKYINVYAVVHAYVYVYVHIYIYIYICVSIYICTFQNVYV